MEIVKRNIADRSPIEGVTYQVRQIDGDFLDTVETDSSGKAFLEVDPGSYEISEVNVPSNVIISEIPQTIFLEPGVTRTVRFFNAVKPSLTVIKRNSITKDPLENAKFHIYYASDNTETGEINDLGGICLSLFLGIAMITLKLWQLADLALPMIILLACQFVFMVLYARFVIFNAMGRDYDAAVLTAGSCGFGMGATPNAMANMQVLTDKYGPSVKAFLLIPLIGSMFADFMNSLSITLFINLI